MTTQYLIGYLREGTALETGDSAKNAPPATAAIQGKKEVTWADIIFSPTWSNFLIPVAISGIIYLAYKGLKALFL
ncbi:unnamed protein product [Gongylonema pulchrum]|uniref:Phage protein n=1 Tax=Gongylonema pulchrum TaxID=637853 RepID=A0A183F116_9BILA|nr:unnamed protein product [Gongylonema pulchrum]